MSRNTIRDRNMDRKQLERWLAEEETGHDEAADAAFAHLFATVQKVEPAEQGQASPARDEADTQVKRMRCLGLQAPGAPLSTPQAPSVHPCGGPARAVGRGPPAVKRWAKGGVR